MMPSPASEIFAMEVCLKGKDLCRACAVLFSERVPQSPKPSSGHTPQSLSWVLLRRCGSHQDARSPWQVLLEPIGISLHPRSLATWASGQCVAV